MVQQLQLLVAAAVVVTKELTSHMCIQPVITDNVTVQQGFSDRVQGDPT